jgi:hypothetical protein
MSILTVCIRREGSGATHMWHAVRGLSLGAMNGSCSIRVELAAEAEPELVRSVALGAGRKRARKGCLALS